MAYQNHWNERGRATSVPHADALDQPRRAARSLTRHKIMPHWLLVAFGGVAVIFAVAQFKVRKTISALAYAGYALSCLFAPWPRVLTYLAGVAAFDGFVDLFRFVVAGGEYSAFRLTEKGGKHFIGVGLAGVTIRSGLLVAAWYFFGF